MAISEVIKFEGSPDDLVWKHPVEDFNTTSQLIVDETHEALLVVNGNAADLFKAGRRTLSLPNIPLLRKIIEIPTGGNTPFPCKVFFINKVHQMDLLWGTHGPIALEDPLYDIFVHVMANGSMSFSIENSRKFLIKLVAFRNKFGPEDMVQRFRGVISSHVKNSISKIMINGLLSYFMINAHVFDISSVVKERLIKVFDEYGIKIHYFNIETIEVPKADYDKISQAKERRVSRLVEGYTWQEERQMMIAEKFAANEGTIGNIGGAVGGFMMGGALGGSIVDIARNALNPEKIPKSNPPKDPGGISSRVNNPDDDFDVEDFFTPKDKSKTKDKKLKNETASTDLKENRIKCPGCGKEVPKGKFCNECGRKLVNVCPQCGKTVPPNSKFCNECGTKLN